MARPGPAQKLTALQESEMVGLVQNGASQREAGRRFGVSGGCVKAALRRAGLRPPKARRPPPCPRGGRLPRDLTGWPFERLVVLSREGRDRWGISTWRCRCKTCDREVIVTRNNLVSGNTKGCGCLRGAPNGGQFSSTNQPSRKARRG